MQARTLETSRRFGTIAVLASLFVALAAGSMLMAAPQTGTPNAQPSALIIETVSLPATYPRALYSFRLQQRGGTSPYRWRVEKGELPRGLKLDEDGTLHGAVETIGDYHFTISVTDSNHQAVQREYTLTITDAISMKWKVPAHVSGGRIEGSVEITNATADDLDFTFVTMAVNEIGRATAIGYQHFPLRGMTTNFEIPFGENLPHGGYVVHVDGVAELAARNQIHRVRLQTPGKLQVAVGP